MNILLLDPRLWENVSSFPINDQDEIKIVYLQKGFFQPLSHNFPKKEIRRVLHRFNPKIYVFVLVILFIYEVNIFKFFLINFFYLNLLMITLKNMYGTIVIA